MNDSLVNGITAYMNTSIRSLVHWPLMVGWVEWPMSLRYNFFRFSAGHGIWLLPITAI